MLLKALYFAMVDTVLPPKHALRFLFVAVICWYYRNSELSIAMETNDKLMNILQYTLFSYTHYTVFYCFMSLSYLEIIKLQSTKVCYLYTTCHTSSC